jgi:diguanylate cyclase (GGDEF)-like protein
VKRNDTPEIRFGGDKIGVRQGLSEMIRNSHLSGVKKQVVLSAVLINIFFIGVISIYYMLLYTETQGDILKTGKLGAVTAASQVEQYISTGINTINLASHTVENMISEGRTSSEIVDFLLNQSVAITNITDGESPGLYGYMNDEYLDGTNTGWDPGEDYDPTVRPWYTQAAAGGGEVAVVDPYLDLDSNTIMIALSKMLSDGKSVVAMDFSMEKLQKMTEEVARDDESDMEVVLTATYKVIAHSDKEEVGKDYSQGGRTFGRMLVKELQSAASDAFEMNYDGKEYMVYVEHVASDWLCLSVTDYTRENLRLNALFILTVLAITFSVCILAVMISGSIRKDQTAEELAKNLSTAESVAFSDNLTGVGSKAAYVRLAENIERGFAEGKTAVAVVMVDANNLKLINDQYGHEAGDKYLRGCCKVICDIYKHSPVFRIGGDEFVAVLTGEDYENREALKTEIKEEFRTDYSQSGRPEWERYSAAVGMSEFKSGDTCLEDILKRADREMYEDKAEFKRGHTSDKA